MGGAAFFRSRQDCRGGSRTAPNAGIGFITFNFSITISDRLLWPFVVLMLLYRRARYGYAFRRIPLTQG
ncbi:MAG TPA: hypothetical protein VMX36_02725, partial [Sedimentisphaerales bacterium]|nr:hypothetical protein [Sedimentisphaerales bacterium]